MPTRACATCETLITRPDWRLKAPLWFCNRKCQHEYPGRSELKLCRVCGEEFRKPRCMASRFQCCEKPECRAACRQGNANANWRGGVTKPRKAAMSRREYKEWRQAVFERDDYTCMECGTRGGELNADHIKPWAYYPELRYDVGNGRTLCLACHKKTYKDVFTHRRSA